MVGGDFRAATGAAEAEGVVLVGGHATFDTGGYYSVGVARVGSRVAPPASSDMLVVGGDVVVDSGMLDVGAEIGGNLVSGGTVTPTGGVQTTGGTVRQNVVGALTPYGAVLEGYRDLSATYAALAPTPGATVTSTGWDVTFRGDGTTARQVFEVDGTIDLGAAGRTKSMVFTNIPLGTIVVVNVTATTAVIGANRFFYDSAAVDPHADHAVDPLFSRFTQSLLWNFPLATTVTLGDSDQLLGSVLIPRGDSTTTVATSTNGRFYAGGDVLMRGAAGAGLEFHSYPFRETSCRAGAVGSLSIAKTLDDPDSVVAANRRFSGDYDCVDASGGSVLSGPWSLAAGDTFVTPSMPAGSTCTVTEHTPPSPSPTDPSYRWAPAAITPPVVVGALSTVAVTVHNAVTRAVGDLEMVKILDDPYGVVDLSRIYTGTFACSHLGVDVTPQPATWAERAGALPVRLATGLPAGTVCSLTEDPILVPPLPGFPQYHWAAEPIFTPARATIVENTVARLSVTNVVEDPLDPPVTTTPPPVSAATPLVSDPPAGPTARLRSLLANTGAETTGPLLVGAVMLLIGLAGLIVKSRTRRARGRR